MTNGLIDALSRTDVGAIVAAMSEVEILTPFDTTVTTFADLLKKPAGVWEGYTTGSHAERVMHQEMRYFGTAPIPAPLSRGSFLLFLLLHDSGKGLGERADQHTYTSQVMDYLWKQNSLPITRHEMDVFRSLLLDRETSPYSHLFAHLYRVRPLGLYPDREALRRELDALEDRRWSYKQLQHYVDQLELHDIDMTEHVERLARKVIEKANEVQLGRVDYLKVLLRYFQCDTSSYSNDSVDRAGVRGYPAFDYVYHLDPTFDQTKRLFVFDAARQRLRFANGLEEVVQQLEARVQDLA